MGIAATIVLLAGCGSNTSSGSCSVENQAGCGSGQVCEDTESGQPACFAPVVLSGRVLDALDVSRGISGATVVARDANGALLSRDLATSGADGSYELAIPATRRADGSPIVQAATLRADAAGFQSFPSGLRVALPMDVSSPTQASGKWLVANASTDVALDRLANADGLSTVHGAIRSANAPGALVVAGSASALAGSDGAFTLFNVPSGDVEVRGYKAGLGLEPANVHLPVAGVVDGVELVEAAGPLGSVAGSLSIVNASARQTSVVLVVKSTFNESLARGEVPLGLRQAPVSSQYSFSGVPAGDYVVLAAFENDELVRDPDTAIGGTAIQEVHVAGAAVTVPGFKVTGALDVMSPGATGPETIGGTPVFKWADDSSEDGYEVMVYDTFGNLVFHDADVPRVSGGAEVSLEYAGPTLSRGYYQFRAVSFRNANGANAGRTYISATEDLKGVFIVE